MLTFILYYHPSFPRSFFSGWLLAGRSAVGGRAVRCRSDPATRVRYRRRGVRHQRRRWCALDSKRSRIEMLPEKPVAISEGRKGKGKKGVRSERLQK